MLKRVGIEELHFNKISRIFIVRFQIEDVLLIFLNLLFPLHLLLMLHPMGILDFHLKLFPAFLDVGSITNDSGLSGTKTEMSSKCKSNHIIFYINYSYFYWAFFFFLPLLDLGSDDLCTFNICNRSR